MLFTQFIGSWSIICLTAFEATVTMPDWLACMQFIIYMITALIQLFLWCWLGNKTYYQVKLLSYWKDGVIFVRNILWLDDSQLIHSEYFSPPPYLTRHSIVAGILWIKNASELYSF